MATIKSYTSLEQSKKLAEILPPESSDMWWREVSYGFYHIEAEITKGWYDIPPKGIPCWSLAALLSVLPNEIEIDEQRYCPCLFPVQDKWLLKLWYNSNYTITSPIAIFSDNPVDAYVEMILKLKRNNML